MAEYTPTMGMTWKRLGEIIRTGYLSGYGGEVLAVRAAEFDAWLAEVERAAAARTLEEAATIASSTHAYRGSVEQWAGREIAASLRARSAEMREGK